MNGGTQRGQADGYDLRMLARLKDVKSMVRIGQIQLEPQQVIRICEYVFISSGHDMHRCLMVDFRHPVYSLFSKIKSQS